MEIDLARIPFTRYGSYLAFSHLPDGLYLRSLRGPATGGRPMQEILKIDLVADGQPVDFSSRATFTRLSLCADAGQVDICLPAADTVRVHLDGAALRFSMPAGLYDNIIPGRAGAWLLTVTAVVETKLQFTPLKGQIVVEAPWQAERSESITLTLTPDADGCGDFMIEESLINWLNREHTDSYEACQQAVDAELNAFTTRLPAVPDGYAKTREAAGYTLWSCVAASEGHLTQPAMYASKNGMIGIWSWDHCFHTLSLADTHPELAWSQMLAIFDMQDASGALPDLVNDRLVSWSFCKPPIHGWALAWLLKHTHLLTVERLRDIYPRVARWTDWWFTCRDINLNDIPECSHGNDTGWDNSTVFAVRPPIESPDISAFLVVQMDFLAQAAALLGRQAEAADWSARADALTERLISHFWRADHFVAIQLDGNADIESASLQLSLPLLLGKRLPAAIRTALIARLKTPGLHLTRFGLATEPLNSPHYRSKGYWRGPIWPAPTLLIIDALEKCDEAEFAGELRRRFCDLVRAEGMAENFDAETGQGYHDFHFSWTASVFLILANQMIQP